MATDRYRVDLSDQYLQRKLRRFPRNIMTRLTDAMFALEEDPRPRQSKMLRGNLSGIWRLRVGSYRILHEIHDDERLIVVLDVASRQSIY